MPNKQSTKILAAIRGSLDNIEQRWSNFEHLRYEIIRTDGTEEYWHIIIAKLPKKDKKNEEQSDEDEH